jgi:hypothetical protein
MSPILEGGLRVTVEIAGANAKHPDYVLYPGDVMVAREDGTYGKFSGLGIEGFRLTPEQIATLEPMEPVGFSIGGISDYLAGEAA